MTIFNIDPTKINLGDLVTSSKGAKIIPLTSYGNVISWQPSGDYVPCFEPSAFNDPTASRVNLSLISTGYVESELNLLDATICDLLAKDSQKYFGQNLTLEQIKERLQPSLRISDKGHKSWRLKMNISGRMKCTCYDENREVREAPECWVDASLRPHVIIKSIWMMNKEFGVVYDLQAAQICETVKKCPFM